MKGLFAVLTLIAFSASAALTDISPIGKVDLKDNKASVAPLVETAEKTESPIAKEVVMTKKPSVIDAKAIYQQSCFACHGTGAAGAPKLGDTAAWAPRISAGEETLLDAALNGKGAMPPKGGNMSLSEEQIKAVVDYMVENSK